MAKFVEVECPNCKNKQVVFSNSASVVKCEKCQQVLVEPKGGKAKIAGKVVAVLG